MKKTLFFNDRSLFGLDISPGIARIMQIEQKNGAREVVGFGSIQTDTKDMKDGVILNPDSIARSIQELLSSKMQGKLSTSRVALSIPAAKTFSRAVKLPKLEKKDIADAVRLEAEQYIPIPIEALYLDYATLHEDENETELFAVAASRQLIDSYMSVAHILNLEPVAIETTIDAATRLFIATDTTNVPAVLVDFGASSADITIVDRGVIATGTVGGGGDNFTNRISKQLGVSQQEAHVIKTMYGLNYSKKQSEISDALNPLLDQLFQEIKRMIRYNEERYGSRHKINQIVLMGAGATLPGLSERMTDVLRLPVRTSDPWKSFKFDESTSIPSTESQSYVTAAGLALITPSELLQ